ncbi:hypothetical protein PYW08_008215 [Mythimna loreyi]|uniref:Uncharacterized protein n=1 Tax=Mythimna loreyi TaxID=667449 RepID=A0ACC2QER9_9NEOP|nr:hypothetical protein PYW08_008215 [Mythimna loreyi]
MAMWGVVFVLAVAGTTVLADPSLTFPELARGASRIVSGWEAQDGQLPHQLSLRMVNPAGGVSSCGGTIIHPAWGLTAAHCTATRVTLVIRAGTVNLTQPTTIFETSKYYNHPLYNEALQSVVQPNDIGLIEFGRELVLGDTIQPIRIQRSSAREQNYAGVQSIASGWGRTWTNGASPENLNWVYLSITSNLECWVAYGGSNIIQPSTICARGYNVTSQSTCQGDSGGPLTVIDVDGAITQVGVTSFVSATGCHTDFPAGFIRPGFYHDWYTEVTGINFDWEAESITTTEAETTPQPDTTYVVDTTIRPVTTPPPEITSETYSTTPDSYSTTPGSYSTTPGSYSTTPDSYSTTPGSYSTTPGSYSTTPGSYSTTPEPYSTTPGSYSTTPGSYSTTPEPYSTTPEPYSTTSL